MIPLEVNTTRNPMARPEFFSKMMQPAQTEIRRIGFETSERMHTHSGVQFEILGIEGKTLRYRIVGDSLGPAEVANKRP